MFEEFGWDSCDWANQYFMIDCWMYHQLGFSLSLAMLNFERFRLFEYGTCCKLNTRGKAHVKQLTIKQNVAWNTIGCLLYQGCQWLTTVVVVLLSQSYENSGALAFAMATGNIFFAIATFSVRTFQVSDISNRFSSGNYVAFRFVTIGIACVICVLYTVWVSTDLWVALATAVYLLFKADESFSNVLYAIDQKASRMDFIGISQGIRGIASIAAFSLGLYFANSLLVAILGMFVCCALVTITYDIPHSRKLSGLFPRINGAIVKDLFIVCTPIVVSTLLYGLVATFARQWFGVRFGTEALGVYAAVATPCVLVQAAASYLYNPFLVPLAQYWHDGRREGFLSLLRKLGVAMLAVSFVCLALAMALGPQALRVVYGQSISEAGWLVAPAMLAACMMAIASFLTDFFVVIRKLAVAIGINAIALALCVLSMNACFDFWYMNGINIVIASSFVAGSVYGLLKMRAVLRGKFANQK